jgi:hypothetical protein
MVVMAGSAKRTRDTGQKRKEGTIMAHTRATPATPDQTPEDWPKHIWSLHMDETREYEDLQIRLAQTVDRARRALWAAEGARASARVIANRTRALRQAEEEYNRLMDDPYGYRL